MSKSPRTVTVSLWRYRLTCVAAAALFVTAVSWAGRRYVPQYLRARVARLIDIRVPAFAPVPPQLCYSKELSFEFRRGLLLVGDSLIERGDWKTLFPEYVVLNHGVGGNTVDCLLYALPRSLRTRPTHMVLLGGVNDLFLGRDVSTIATIVWLMLAQIKNADPELELFVLEPLPIRTAACVTCPSDINVRASDLGKRIRKIADTLDVRFIETKSALADVHGELVSEYTFDGIHLTPRGYRVLANRIRESISRKIDLEEIQ